ncbi:fatty acid synthase-like [Linepithema humile]|uniref:fatty acid synthase-like n=1 Tax=Linepithema humile TaxID=83485 RepID=UPI00351F7130
MGTEKTYKSYINTESSDEIVISGIAGRFPDSDNIKQLQENLFNKINLLRTNPRWNIEHPDLPARMGTINNLEKFDADFFHISFKQANLLDPMIRMLLEHTYEAIIDAGINPKQLRGKNTAVIVGTSYIESQETLLYKNLQIGGGTIAECAKYAVANMLSHSFHLKGPSYVVDTACSSSLYAIAFAYDCIMSGRCEDAIVGATNLCLHPITNMQFFRLGVLSSDGYCRPFDTAASGYSRSETISIVYLQKAKNAKRIYAICKQIKLNNDGYKEEGITYPSTHMQSALLTEFYNECEVPPSYLDYIEAHGTGTKVGDLEEINAIRSASMHNVLCQNRKTPLMVGSVKSNLGHAEPASGITQIAKVIIAFETGFVPPNINFTSPRNDIDALMDGSIRVITEAMPLKNGYVGINSFGFGGANAHMLLQWNVKKKINNGVPTDDLPRLVVLSGCTEESVKLFLDDIANHPIDVEYIRLLHDIHTDDIDGHSWRGYIILDSRQKNSIQKIQNCKSVKRSICFIFSAFAESQWPKMGQELLKFHAFANAVKMCDTILKPYDISITNILTKMDVKLNENTLQTFVGIIAIQICLVDLLTSIDIIPDYIIGHFAGELGCAYADGCLTMEQTILSAYFIGLACVKEKLVYSSIAVVNFDYNSLKGLCPEDIEIICRNNQNSNIVTGPAKSMQEFLRKLQNSNIDVKAISCNNMPHHSRYLASLKSQFFTNLNKIIAQPKERSPKWISTSIPRNEWSYPTSKLCSASYHMRSILNTVLFDQTTHMIPDDAIIIEIAPNSILQDILKESVHPKVTNIVLTTQNEPNAIDLVLQGIGELYNCGRQPRIANLYPPVNFPVSRGTPMISPSIRWNHSKDWFVYKYETKNQIKSKERQIEIIINSEDYSFMTGHVIDGRNLLPATGYLMLVWETIGMMKGKIHTSTPIVFQDIKFIRATHLSNNGPVNLAIAIQKEGKFEVTEGDSVVVTGVVYAVSNAEQEMVPNDLLSVDTDEEEHMSSRDIYKELRLRGYQYSDAFCGLNSASISGSKGHITWIGNWVAFMDNMLQMYIIGKDVRDLYIPTSIEKLVINPALHESKLGDVKSEKNKQVPIRVYKEIDVIKSGGIEIRGLKATPISRRKPIGNPVIEEHKFIAHQDRADISLNEAIRISTQLALEDYQIIKATAIELVEDTDDVMLEDLSSTLLIEAFADIPLIQANVAILTSPNRFKLEELSSNVSVADLNEPFVGDKALIATGFNLLTKHQNSLKKLLPLLRDGGYLLTREKCNLNKYEKYLSEYALNVILEKRTDKEIIILLKKKVIITKTILVYINNNNFNWLEDLKQLVDDENKHDGNSRIVIVGEGDFECGLLGFINCLKKEPGGQLVRGVLIQDKHAPKFSLQDPFYMQQLQKDISVSVLRPNKTWGSYRHLRLPHPEVESVTAAYVCQTVHGDLSSFCWIENNISVESHGKDIVRVVYSSINFKDVMLATGKLTSDIKSKRLQDMSLGLEYVGYDSNGQRVMGICDNKCIANVVVREENFFWNIPDTWTFEEAATVPCIYGTNYYALYHFGKMKKGDKVLIHSGTGGIGQSAIHLALQEGCQVFTTVGTAEKRKFIRKLFPAIPDEHIGNSRDTSFEQMIMRQTNGRGVDIVLNSLAEEKLIASVRCLAKRGRFLEIGKFDIISNNPLYMSLFKKGISFYPVLLDELIGRNHKNKSQLYKLMAKGLKNGNIKPIQSTVFPKTEIEAAFRYMASGKHMGKIIINIQEDGKSLDSPVLAHRRYYCLRDRTYIILGGLGGFGLELTDWLILRGAKNVLLTSETGIKNGYQRMRIELWKSYGVNVQIVKNANLANLEECEHFLQMAEKQAPIDAIFNLAVVLKDCLLRNQTMETFTASFLSKAWMTQTLDKASRKICLKLRHFVMFSSVSCGKGNAGQTNYGMANSIMERVCEKRAEEGLPGLAIQWGAVGDVGLVADMQENNKELVIGGTLQQKISSCLVELEKFLLQNRPIVSSMIVSEKKTRLSGLDNIVEIVANIMNIRNMKIINQNTSLAELGMDSMMTVEIRQTFEREFDILLTPRELRTLTFAKLIEMSNVNVSNETQTEEATEAATDINKTYLTKEQKLLFGVLRNQDFVSEICLDLPTNTVDNSTHVFFIPGLDGCGTIFNHLTLRIKFSATSLQYGYIGVANTLSEMADHLLMCISSRIRDKKKVVITGYSFGSLLAIELIRRLEATDTKSRLVLIDGSPEYIMSSEINKFCYMSDEEIQINIMIIILKIYETEIDEEVLLELRKCETWEERFEVFAQYFSKENSLLSRPNLQTLYATIYKNILSIRQYDSSTLLRIKSPITLLKPTLSYAPELEEDYGLYKITENKVVVHYVKGSHVTILANEKVAAVINEEAF